MRVEQALRQFLLRADVTEWRGDRSIGLRPDVAPAVEVFRGRTDGAELRGLAAGADHGEVRVEQFRLAFAQPGAACFRAGIAIALQLYEGLVHRVCGVGVANL